MSTIAVTVITADVTPETFLEAAAKGTVRFHTVRANGSTRRVQFYAADTKAREEAEWVAEQRADGRTMKAIAEELHMSVPSVRRMLNALLLAEEVEGYEPEEVEELLAEAAALRAEQQPTPEAEVPVADQEPSDAPVADASTEAAPVAETAETVA